MPHYSETSLSNYPQAPCRALLPPAKWSKTSDSTKLDTPATWNSEESQRLQRHKHRTFLQAWKQLELVRSLTFIISQPSLISTLPRFITDLELRHLQQDHAKSTLTVGTKVFRHHSTRRTTRSKDPTASRMPRTIPKRRLRVDFGPEVRHRQRKEELLAQLNPIVQHSNGDCSHVFLCWGRSSQCEIATIEVPNSADDVAVWKLVRQGWYAARGKWRRYIRIFDVQRLEVVQVGQRICCASCDF